jgi:hypothetical protein
MDCPVIAVKHCEDGTKGLSLEKPVGRHWDCGFITLSPLTANMLMKELISIQRDGGWARIPVKF